MILTELTIEGFKCHERLQLGPLDRLAVFVGENDVGKSVIFEAIEILVSGDSCTAEHFRERADGSSADEIVIAGEFRLEEHDKIPDELTCDDGRYLRLRRRFTKTTSETTVEGIGYVDARFDDFQGLSAGEQRGLLAEFKAHIGREGSNAAARKEQVAELAKTGILKQMSKPVAVPSFSALRPYLPRVERISAADYANPDSVIQRTLRTVASSVIKPINQETEQAEEIPALAPVREAVESALNTEVAKALETLRAIHPGLKELRVEPVVDFTQAIRTTPLCIDTGSGTRNLSMFGEGTKRRMWMGLLDWERRAAGSSTGGSVLRLYDEPDVNLHYRAQRQLFTTISDWANDSSLHTQCVVCTHAITLIDRAPLSSISLIRINDEGQRVVDRLQASDDAEVSRLFDQIAHEVGLSNTALLYERAFLVFEGPSEQMAVPILYQVLFGRSPGEDGIVTINLEGCGGWKPVMSVLLRNRLPMVHILLDEDCRTGGTPSNVSEDDLRELGAPADFLITQVTFIGQKEFEDAFTDDVIVSALNAEYPRQDGRPWHAGDLQQARESDKFSRELSRIVVAGCERSRKQSANRKPELAAAVARQCRTRDDIPDALIRALEAVRTQAGAA